MTKQQLNAILAGLRLLQRFHGGLEYTLHPDLVEAIKDIECDGGTFFMNSPDIDQLAETLATESVAILKERELACVLGGLVLYTRYDQDRFDIPTEVNHELIEFGTNGHGHGGMNCKESRELFNRLSIQPLPPTPETQR